MVQICKRDHNGYVFIPNDGLENCAINTLNHKDVYVGILQRSDTFITDKGYESSYLPWSPDNPTKDVCVVRSYLTGEFRSNGCNSKMHIICETDHVVKGAVNTTCDNSRKHNYFAQILQYNGFSFRIFDFKKSKSEARNLCSLRGEVLFVSRDQIENCVVMENSEFSIGLNYGTTHLRDVLLRGDGYKDNYTNWASGYPVSIFNNGCVYAYYDTGKWKNEACHDSYFVCREVRKDQNSTTNCSTKYYESLKDSYSLEIGSKTYTLFGWLLSYHDSVRLCSYYDQKLIQTTDSETINQINKHLINTTFHVNYRILWNDANLTWLDSSPSVVNWAPGEPKLNDFLISCVSVLPNQTWVTNSCHNKNMAICVKDSTKPSTKSMSSKSMSSKSMSSKSMSSTSMSSTSTMNKTKNVSQTTNKTKSASKKSNKVAIGVGTFFAILVVLGGFGFFIYKKKFHSNKIKNTGVDRLTY